MKCPRCGATMYEGLKWLSVLICPECGFVIKVTKNTLLGEDKK